MDSFLVRVLTQMEVVVLSVADDNETADEVDKRCKSLSVPLFPAHPCPFYWQSGSEVVRTHRPGVLAVHVPVLVPLDEALGLRLRCWAARELLVESDDSLHAGGICGTANGLYHPPSAPVQFKPIFHTYAAIIICYSTHSARICGRGGSSEEFADREYVRWAKRPAFLLSAHINNSDVSSPYLRGNKRGDHDCGCGWVYG